MQRSYKFQLFRNKVNRAEFQKHVGPDFLVVGAGIMGATIAQSLQNRGQEVLVFDNEDPEAGSKPCGGLMKPSRFTGLSNEEFARTVDVLSSCFEIKKIPMMINPSGNLLKAEIYEVNMDDIFGVPHLFANVLDIDVDRGVVYMTNHKNDKKAVVAKTIIVAAGMGCQDLFPDLFGRDGLKAKRGFSFHFDGAVEMACVKFWAPYKQVTLHNSTFEGKPILWAGDGSALTLPSWYDGRIDEGLARVRKELPADFPLIRTLKGMRSFSKDKKPCHVEKIGKCWVATGAGKMGLIAAGYSANKILHYELR